MDIINYVKSLPYKNFDKDELLLASGDPSDTFMAIRDGFVKVTSTDDAGRQKLLWIAGRYDIIPLERFFTRKVLQYDYVGFSAGSAYVVDKQQFHDLIKQQPQVSTEIAMGMSEHYDDVLERLSAAGQSDIRSKLLHMLYNLSAKFSSAEVVEFHEIGLYLTHQDLADMIGASREVVSLELAKIRKSGFIDYSRLKLTVYPLKIREEMNLLA